MRHGQAEAVAATDQLRPLSSVGQGQARRIACSLIGIDFHGILCSPYLRARETASIVQGVVDGPEPAISERFTPDGSPGQALQSLPEQGVWLLVSHMPLVSRLTGLLVDGDDHAGPGFHTAMVAELDMDYPASGLAWLRRTLRP